MFFFDLFVEFLMMKMEPLVEVQHPFIGTNEQAADVAIFPFAFLLNIKKRILKLDILQSNTILILSIR